MDESTFDLKLGKLMGLSDEIDEMQAKLKELNAAYDELNYELVQYMQQTDCQGKKLYGRNFYLTSRTFVKLEDAAAFEAWVEKNNAYKTVFARHAGKLQAYCEECLQNAQPIPDGVTPGFIKHSVAIRRDA